MLTGLLAVRNLMDRERHDLWSVNTDQEYHEEMAGADAEDVEAVAGAVEGRLAEIFPRMDGIALGVATGTVAGLLLALATLFLVIKGGPVVGPNLGLLGQFLPGYTVTGTGSLLGLFYGLTVGFLAGWGFALLRNLSLFLSLAILRRRAQLRLLKRFLEFV